MIPAVMVNQIAAKTGAVVRNFFMVVRLANCQCVVRSVGISEEKR
jgi:hypothetical protein